MPTNLHALIRYRTIDDCLQRRYKTWSWENLSEACSEKLYEFEGLDALPCRRTIMYDIRHMRSGELGYYAPIEYDRIKKTYFYTDPDFSIQKFPLSRDDLFELQYAVSILRHFKGFRDTAGIENIITKLEHTVSLSNTSGSPIIHFDHSLNEPGNRWLDELYHFIRNEQVLEITYHPFQEKWPYKRIISPYLLKEYDNRWFLVCWDHLREAIRNFALDRLKSVEKKPIRFYRDPDFNQEWYFKSVIGISIPEEGYPTQIRFIADPKDAQYLQTKPLHPSQSLEKITSSGTVFSIEVIPNYELESVLLAFGESLQVIEPEWLRQKLSERVDMMQRRYG